MMEPPMRDPRENLIDWLHLFWRHRQFLKRAVAIGLAASTVVAFLIPKSYVSTTQLMPPDSQSSMTNLAMMAGMAARVGGGTGSVNGNLGSVAGDLLGLKTSGALFIGVLRSQTAQDELVQRFNLQKVYRKRLVAGARGKLDENTAIAEDRKSGIISISVTDHDPQRAAALANGYVDELNTLVVSLSTSSAHRERVFLEDRLKVVKQNLDDASNQLAQFSSKSGTLEIQQEGKAMLDVAATLAGEMIATQSQLEGLRQIYTDNNPRVQALKARVTEIQKELGNLSGNGKPSDNGGGSGDGSATSTMAMPSIRSLPLLGAKYSDYYRSAKIQETVYELLTQQYELAKVQEAKETPSIKILDPALVPEEKSFPPRLMIIFLGTSLAFITGAVWVFGVERWKMVDAEDPRKIFLEDTAHALGARLSRAWKAVKKEKSADPGVV